MTAQRLGSAPFAVPAHTGAPGHGQQAWQKTGADFAGRYATPVVVPPCVAIIGAGKLCHDLVAVMGGMEVHRRMPISLTFDHRACTGGEAARYLEALLDDLSAPH